MSRVRVLDDREAIALPEHLLTSIGFTGLDPWLFFTRKVYGFPVYRIVSESAGAVDGWLALVQVRHPVFGRYLATSPFGSYGGFAYGSNEARDNLLETARGLSHDLGAD